MPRVHDRGGWPGAGPLNRTEHDFSMREKRTDALLVLLSERNLKVETMKEWGGPPIWEQNRS
jgi:hypothetical protein